jgi:hypothetical protein
MNESFGQLEFRNSNVGRLINLEDFNGRSLLKKYDPDISGSPFINADWLPAKVTLLKGKEIGPLLVKLNIESNELYFIDTAGKELIAAEGIVKKIDFTNYYSKDSIRYVFKNGYPVVDKQNENFYYQLFTEGKIELLAKKIKYISTTKNAVTGEISKDFVNGAIIWYIYINDNIQAFHPNKDFIFSLMIDKSEEIKIFLGSNKINLKKTSDLIKLFNYYNGLNQ